MEQDGLNGAHKFINRVWNLVVDENGKLRDRITTINEGELDLVYNQTVKKVTEDYEKLHFNTAISQLMVMVNDFYKAQALPLEYVEGLVKLLAPITPHMAEELWALLGHNESIAYAQWPTYNENKLVEDTIEVVVQLNGKIRQRLKVSRNASKEELESLALADEKVKAELEGKTIRRVIAVPGKLVNIVAN